MKRASKWIVLALALTFLFAMAAPAFAGTEDTAAAKLKALGILEGDPNGDLRLGDTITRAEFAKIAVVASGNKDAADLLKNTPSVFSDVQAGAWYTGWINLAESLGFVKGDPDGKFRPNDNISYAEVITVLLRVLGFNDNLPGNWPVDYIVKAANLGITDDVQGFDAKAPAVRGNVAIVTSETLENNIVEYSKDKENFTETVDTLMAENFKGTSGEGLVAGVQYDVDKKVSLTLTNGTVVKVDSAVALEGAGDVEALYGKKVSYVLKKKDGVDYAVFVSVKDTNTVSGDAKGGTDTDLATNKIKIGSTTYEVAAGALYALNYETADALVVGDEVAIEGAEVVNLVLNKNGKAELVYAFNYVSHGIVDQYDAKDYDVEFKTGATIALDEDSKVVVIRNGAVANLEDIAENDIVYNFTVAATSKGANLDAFFVVTDGKASGELEGASSDWKKVYVSGKSYDIKLDAAPVAQLSTDSGDKFADFDDNVDDATHQDLQDLYEEDVTLLLGLEGDVEAVVASITGDSGNKIDVVFIQAFDNVYTGTGKYRDDFKAMKLDGQQLIYQYKDDTLAAPAVGALLTLTLKDDGTVDKVEAYDAAKVTVSTDVTAINTKNDYITLAGGAVYFITSDTKIVDTTAVKTKDWGIVPWSSVEGSNVAGAADTVVVAFSQGTAKYVVIDGLAVATEKSKAVVTDKGTNADGYYVTFLGDTTKHTVTTQGLYDAVAKGNFVEYSFNASGDINALAVYAGQAENDQDIDDISGNIIIVNGTPYLLNSSTVIYDVKDTTKLAAKTQADLEEGQTVDLWSKDGAVTYILIVN